MADSKKTLESGMYNVKFTKDFGSYKKGDTAVYHSSTAQTLRDKGALSVEGKIAKYVPKAAKI